MYSCRVESLCGVDWHVRRWRTVCAEILCLFKPRTSSAGTRSRYEEPVLGGHTDAAEDLGNEESLANSDTNKPVSKYIILYS